MLNGIESKDIIGKLNFFVCHVGKLLSPSCYIHQTKAQLRGGWKIKARKKERKARKKGAKDRRERQARKKPRKKGAKERRERKKERKN